MKMKTIYKIVPVEDKINDINGKQQKYGYGVRHIQVLVYFICLFLSFLSGGHLGVTIVAMTMVKQETYEAIIEGGNVLVTRTITNSTSTGDKIEIFDEKISSVLTEKDIDIWNVYKTYNWPKSVQELVLGSMMLGSFLMMFPIGLVCQRWGGKIPLQFAMLVNGVTSFLAPWLVSWGDWQALCVVRLLQGISQAGMYPAISTLLSNWVPASERGSLSSYVFAATGVGGVVTFQLAGILAFSGFGWPSTFWVAGVACLIGFIIITIYVTNTPTMHKTISEAEKAYIMGESENCVNTKTKVPWMSVVRSTPVWATIAAQIGNSMCFMFFFIQVPTYMFAVLKVNVMSSGILTSLPYLASIFSSISFGYLSDFLTNTRILSVKNARRIFNSIACVIPAISLTLVAFTTDTILTVACFIVFLSANTAMHTGWMLNFMDLSPNFSGVLMATGNTVTNIFIVTQPLIVSNIVTDVTNQYQWRIAMFLMAAITFFANIIFVLFMSADVQPWNNGDDDKQKQIATKV